MLHARSIKFIHPVTQEALSIIAPLPEDIQTVIQNYFPGLSALDA